MLLAVYTVCLQIYAAIPAWRGKECWCGGRDLMKQPPRDLALIEVMASQHIFGAVL